MKSYFLYKIENKLNGKLYIGLTIRPKIREYEHLKDSKRGSVSLIKQAVIKYGASNFVFTVICEGTKDYIVELEKKAIEHFNTLTPNGYNIRPGGEDCGSGYKIRKRTDDTPLYLKGFWFPSLRACSESLGVSKTTVMKWRKSGVHGEERVLTKPRKDSRDVPVYVGGFWFPTLSWASESLSVKRKTLMKRIKDGFIEQESRASKQGRKGDGTFSMTGKTGFLHHNSRAVEINGTVYGSISEASKQTEFTKKMIYTRIKNKTPGFAWLIEE